MSIKELENKIAAKAFELGYCLPLDQCIAVGEEVMVAMKGLHEKLVAGVAEEDLFSAYVEYVKECYSTEGKTAISKAHLTMTEQGFYTQEEVDAIAADLDGLAIYWNETAKPIIMETYGLANAA